MQESPLALYVEMRNGGYYVAGTRLGLDIIVEEFQRGRSPESILQDYPSIGSLAKVYGVITFILENPDAVAAYLKDQERLWDEVKQKHPIPVELLERLQRARELSRKSA
jgi:uncharacterized protein (DUF433 family)